MSSAGNVINLAEYRALNTREVIDDISARAFLFLRDEAEAEDVPMYAVIAEHMLGMALVVQAVEGSNAAHDLLKSVAAKLNK
ncbi:MAG: hypothetical protein JWM78_1546 [Verrucomicrobiaceae bacterium]|nr:hypothetical protein [Verrucomicrobiaceae bacterium]